MKKVLNFLKLRYLYIYFLIYIVIDYFVKGRISNLGVFNFIDSYFGITIFPIIIILLFSILFPFMNNKTKKMLLSVRLYCFFLLSISSILLYLMYILKLPFEKMIADDKIIIQFLQLALYKYKIGLVATYGFYLLLTNIMFMYIYIGLGIIIFCTTFLIAARCINRGIKRLYNDYKERKRIAREERLIKEQIAIKEALERREAMMKEKFEREQENKIKERVDEILLNNDVMIKNYSEGDSITLEETNNDDSSILSEDAKNFNLFVINDFNKKSENKGNLNENIADKQEDKNSNLEISDEKNTNMEIKSENFEAVDIEENKESIEEESTDEKTETKIISKEEVEEVKNEETNKNTINDIKENIEDNIQNQEKEIEILNLTEQEGEQNDTSIEIPKEKRDS